MDGGRVRLWGDYFQIGVTEPRRVAVTTLATRVAEEQNTQLGRRVGYSIRFDECFMRTQTKIKYMTEGILIREMMEDPLLKAGRLFLNRETRNSFMATLRRSCSKLLDP